MHIDPTHEEIARRAVFVLEYGEAAQMSQGTAFLLEGVGLVTAHHVLETMDVPWADLFRPHDLTKKFRARPSSRKCPHRDLVILEHDLPEEEQVFLKPGAVPPRTREPILALGFPSFDHGDELSMRPGEIVARPTRHGVKYIEVDATLDNGLSGGPIVNDRYEVMGVVHWGGGDISRQLAVNISEVIAFANESTSEGMAAAT
jgi:RNA-directed DNA polymerase